MFFVACKGIEFLEIVNALESVGMCRKNRDKIDLLDLLIEKDRSEN